MKRKISVIAICVILCGMLAACGKELDARGYLQAMLDLSYKGDSAAYVEMELGTAEDAAALYERGINSEMSFFKEKLNMSEELEADFRSLFKDIYAKAKYTVGAAKKQKDGSFVVEITCERLKVFEPALTVYNERIAGLPEAWAAMETSPTQEEMLEDMTEILRDALRESIDSAAYEAQETLTIRIELIDNVYTPNTQDVISLEKALFDSDYSLENAEGSADGTNRS